MSTLNWELPEFWGTALLGTIAPEDSSQILPADYPTKSFNYWGLDAIEKGQFDEPAPNYVLGSEVRSICVQFDTRHILYAKLRPYLNKVIAPSVAGIGSTEWLVLKPNPKIIDRKFLAYILRSNKFVEYASSNISGARMPRARKSALWEAPIPIPYPDDPERSLAEQRRIVARLEAMLEEVRAMRALLQSMRADWDALMESALAEVFPSQGRELPHGWEWVKVAQVVQDIPRRNPESEPDTSFQYVDIAAVDNQDFRIVPERVKTLLGKEAPSRARKVIHAGDVILATTRPYLKNIAIVPEEFDNQICSTGFCVLSPITGKVDTRYLYYVVKTDLFIKQLLPKQRGANYPAVTDGDVFDSEIPIPYPDDPERSLAEQRRIVAYLEALQGEVSAARQSLEEDERRVSELEQSILAAAFRGEV